LKWQTEVLAGTLDALLSGQADLSIGLIMDNVGFPPSLTVQPLGDVPFAFVVAPHHPLASVSRVLEDADIIQHRAVAVADTSRRVTPLTYNLLEGQDVLTVSTIQAKVDALVLGLGCGYVPQAQVAAHVQTRRLVTKATARGPRLVHMGYGWRTLAAPRPKKAPQGLALAWWIKQLESESTRAALTGRAALGLAA
jgi:DNA-binding transcriptional LysR family regulator